MKIEFRNIDINEKFFNPTLRIGVKLEYTIGMEALMNAFGNLNYEGKIIGKLELENENNLSFAIYALDETQNKNSYPIDLFFKCVLNREVIRYINDTRKKAKNGDVNLSVDIKLLYLEPRTFITNYKSQPQTNIKLLSTHNGNTYLEIRNASASFSTRIKASDWVNDFAPNLGLGEYEIIEIKKFIKNVPAGAMGFEEILNKIDQANTKLLKGGSPEDILSDLRSTWDVFDQYHKDYFNEINKLIRGNSKKEEKEPPKEERIEKIHKAMLSYLGSINDLKESIDKFTQIGPHRETYYSTREDAELALRLSVSLIAYYSVLLSKINKESDEHE